MNQTILAPLVRVGLRYLSGGLMALGFSSAAAGAVSTEAAAGVAVLLISEGWYLLAKRAGWRT